MWDPSLCACHCVNSYDEGDGEGAFMIRIHLWTIPEETSTFGVPSITRCPASVPLPRQATHAGEDPWNEHEWTLFIMAGWAAVLMLWHNPGKNNLKKRVQALKLGWSWRQEREAGPCTSVVRQQWVTNAYAPVTLLFIPPEPSPGIMPLRFRAGVFTFLTVMPRGARLFCDARSRWVEDKY